MYIHHQQDDLPTSPLVLSQLQHTSYIICLSARRQRGSFTTRGCLVHHSNTLPTRSLQCRPNEHLVYIYIHHKKQYNFMCSSAAHWKCSILQNKLNPDIGKRVFGCLPHLYASGKLVTALYKHLVKV